MMKAIGVTTFGGPEVLHVVELPEPHAGAGEVRMRVHAASVNPALPHLSSVPVFATDMASCCFKLWRQYSRTSSLLPAHFQRSKRLQWPMTETKAIELLAMAMACLLANVSPC